MERAETADLATLAELPALNARLHGDAIALKFEGRETSFAQFDSHTSRIAGGLAALGLQPGDRIAYLGRNSDAYFELLFGAMRARVVTVPVGWRLSPPEIDAILAHSQARAIFVEHAFLRPELARIGPCIMIDDGPSGLPAFRAWRDRQSPPAQPATIRPQDVALQVYTSGTTGHPKGAMLTHAGFLAIRRLLDAHGGDAARVLPGDISLLAMPVAHVGGTTTGLWAMWGGIKSVVARQFDPDDVLDFIAREGVNNFFLVPSALQRIVRDPRARTTDFSRIRYITYGGSPMPRALLDECRAVCGCEFAQGYGMTETWATVVVLAPEDHTANDGARLNACGKPVPAVQVQIRDAEGRVLGPGEVGQIALHTPSLMLGYWRDPVATAEAIDPEGWLLTGDAGYLDRDGYLYIHDRVKDMIVSGGENIYPAEVENAIYGHPAVAEVAVIGIPSERWGEEVRAIVVVSPGATLTEVEVIAHARSRIAAFKAPKSVEFVSALPRNGSGKILRRVLREPYWAGRHRQVN